MCPLPPDCSSPSRWMVKRAAAKKVSRAKILIPVTFLSALSRYRQSSTNATTAIQFHPFYPFQWLLLQICNIWFISIFYFIFRCAVSFVNLSFTLVKVAPRYLYICLSLFLMFAYLQTWFGFGQLHEEGEGVRGGGGVTCGILVRSPRRWWGSWSWSSRKGWSGILAFEDFLQLLLIKQEGGHIGLGKCSEIHTSIGEMQRIKKSSCGNQCWWKRTVRAWREGDKVFQEVSWRWIMQFTCRVRYVGSFFIEMS